ncbi:MAG: hypothetical protein R3324_01365, partial [Halobacteriales archaeon]|nr:hypothetical protein [Halobacteriales archaeon]
EAQELFTRFNAAGTDDLADLVDLMDDHRDLSRHFFRETIDGSDAQTYFREQVINGRLREIPTAGPLSLKRAKQAFRTNKIAHERGWDRLFRQMPGRAVSLEDLDQGFWQLNDFIVSAGIDRAKRSEFLDRWMRLGVDDARGGAFQIMGDVMNEMGTKLKAEFLASSRVPKPIADALEQSIDELTDIFNTHESMVAYFTDINGNPAWHPGAKLELIDEAGEVRSIATAHLVSEFLERGIPLPDPREVRRAVGDIQQLMRKTTPGAFASDFGPNKLTKYILQPYMQRFWKPMTLLRFAWPMRVIPEEQIRMATTGLDSVFKNPLSFLTWAMQNPELVEAGAKGTRMQRAVNAIGRLIPERDGLTLSQRQARGQEGVLAALNDASPDDVFLAAAKQFQDATNSRLGQFLLGMSDHPNGQGIYVKWTKGDKPFTTSWQRELKQLIDDPLAEQIALNGEARALQWLNSKEGKRYLSTRTVSGRGDLNSLFDAADEAGEQARRLLVESVWARNHIKAGGRAQLYFDGVAVDPERLPREFADAIQRAGSPSTSAADAAAELGRIRYEVTRNGDAQVMRLIGTGELVDRNTGDVLHVLQGNVSKDEWDRVTDILGRNDWQAVAPQTVKGVKSDPTGVGDRVDEIVGRLFESLMSSPTNTLSRAPTFKQYYWQRMEEMLPFASENVQDAIVAAARKTNLDATTISRMETRIDSIRKTARNPDDLVDNIADLDNLGKAFGLDKTRQLLYDTSRRNQFMDQMANLIPFGEAWLEILSTWRKLLWENPEVFRRAQQGIVGARGSGFFETDPETGEEMFNYPGGGLLSKMLFGSESQPQIKLQGRVSGLNLITGSVLPGLGPAGAIPASYLLSNPAFDGVKKVLLPFGGQYMSDGLGSLVNDAVPSWARRLIQSTGAGEPEQKRLFANTVMDVYKGLLIERGGGPMSLEEQNRLLDEARSKARSLTAIRGIAQLFLPTGPETRFFAVAEPDREAMGDAAADDLEGRLFLFQTLGSAYREKLFETDDDVAAFDWFVNTFGFDPTIVATAKTEVVQARNVTEEGDRWARSNPHLFDAAPFSAYYAHPDDPTDTSFDYEAYLRSIREAAREPLTPEQWAAKRNDLLGRIRYQRYQQEADRLLGQGESQEKRRLLQNVRYVLMQQHPGYRLPNPGSAERAAPEQIIREIEDVWFAKVKAGDLQGRVVNELEGRTEGEWKYPELALSDTGKAARTYLLLRERARFIAQRQLGLSPDGWKSANGALELRQRLRAAAERLIDEYPDFEHLWTTVLSREMIDDTDTLAQASLGATA